jgi:prepilin-type processing-associated H-X9-DG protein
MATPTSLNTAVQGWSVHAAILPQLGEMPLYNAINFNWGMSETLTQISYVANLTVYSTYLKEFVCPSDPNASTSELVPFANNSYYGCIGSTTDVLGGQAAVPISLANVPTSGLFAFQQSKAMQSVIDGSSNTVAFSEAILGNPKPETPVKKLNGLNSVTLAPAALQLNALNNQAGVLAGIQACDAAWKNGANGDARGDKWVHGGMSFTLFNTVVTPNAKNSTWTYCSTVASGGAQYANADSYHPGGINVLMADGHISFVKDAINQRTWWGLGTINGSEVIGADSY